MTARIRASAGAAHARILGLGTYRPARVVTNSEICRRIDSSDEWIRARSGIRTRRVAGPAEPLLDMAAYAAGKALADSGVLPDQVGCVLVATSTYLMQTPPAAPQVAHRLGIAGAGAFDVAAGCAGFCYGLALAADMIRAGSAGYVVVIGVERMSDCVDPTDRSTAFIFGDGAGAVVVGPSETPGIGPVAWGSDGSGAELIRQEPTFYELHEDRTVWPAIRMEGMEVFRWASFRMARVARAALDAAGVAAADLDAFIPHQANLRITEAMTRALKLPEHVLVARDIVEAGNTSAASVPLAMETMLASGEVRGGGTALLIAFGAGLTYAAQVVRLPAGVAV